MPTRLLHDLLIRSCAPLRSTSRLKGACTMYVLQNGAIVVSAVAALVLFLTGIQQGPQFGLLVRSATLVHILLCWAASNLLMSGGDDLCAYNLAQTIGAMLTRFRVSVHGS